MSTIALRPPLYVPPALEPTSDERKQRIQQACRRLKLVKWLTLPVNCFPAIPDWGLALKVTSESVRWHWRTSGGAVYVSAELVWLGFRHNVWPNEPLTL